MARTQVQSELLAVNSISGTIIADNAITATHIATNAISGTLVQDGGIVTTMIAANNVTAAKIVSDGVEARHLHSNVISGQSAVTAASGDYVLIGDTSDSNNLKKALVSDLGNDLDGAITINESGAAVDFRVEGDTKQHLFFVDGSEDKIGIGVSTPSSMLHLFDGGTDTNIRIQAAATADNTSSITFDSRLADNSNKQAFLKAYRGNIGFTGDSGYGKVGIGTNSPSYSLDVVGPGTSDGVTLNLTDVASSAVNFVSGGTEKARIDTNGLKITHTSHTGESNGQPDVVKTSFGGIHFESGSSGTSRGITWEASDGNTQAGIVCHNNGADGTHLGFFTTYTYAGGPICNMKLTNYGTVVAGASTDVMSVSPASTTAFHSNYGDILCNASNNDILLSDLLPGYSRNAYATIKSTGSYMYFSVNGSYSHYLGSSGGLTASDSRLKENVSTLTNSLSKVKQLRGVNFTWKDTEKRGSENNIGFIAQEVETIYPELVGDGGLPKDDNGEDAMKAVNYEKLVPVLVEAIKELEARIKTLEG